MKSGNARRQEIENAKNQHMKNGNQKHKLNHLTSNSIETLNIDNILNGTYVLRIKTNNIQDCAIVETGAALATHSGPGGICVAFQAIPTDTTIT